MIAETADHDLREGGTWTPSQRLKNALIAGLVAVTLLLVDRIPERLLLALGRRLGATVNLLFPRLRAAARSNLARVLPEPETARASRDAFACAGENLALCLLLRRRGSSASRFVQVSAEAGRLLEHARAAGRGVVFISAHHGPFELLPVAVSELGHPCSVVVRESYDPRLDRLVDAHRHLHGVAVIHRGHPGAATRIVRALRENRIVGFLPDLESRVPSTAVRFMGRSAAFPTGPQRIAARTGARIVVGWLERCSTAGRPSFVARIKEIQCAGDSEQAQADTIALTLERGILTPSRALGSRFAAADWLGWLRESPRER